MSLHPSTLNPMDSLDSPVERYVREEGRICKNYEHHASNNSGYPDILSTLSSDVKASSFEGGNSRSGYIGTNLCELYMYHVFIAQVKSIHPQSDEL